MPLWTWVSKIYDARVVQEKKAKKVKEPKPEPAKASHDFSKRKLIP
jgi:hypothetical protein